MPNSFIKKGVFLQENGDYRYSVMVPTFLCDSAHFAYDHHEKDRFASMEANLRQGDVLFDVGIDVGWMSVLWASFVGEQNVCLFESASALWPNIREVWEQNNLAIPRATVRAFIGKKSISAKIFERGWTDESLRNPLENREGWAAHFHTDEISPQMTLDDFSRLTSIKPSAITMDIEGAEGWALLGSSEILERDRPLTWISIHPEDRLRKFASGRQTILGYMSSKKYGWQYLGVDHEEHYFFYPLERKESVVFVPPQWHTYNKRDVLFEDCIIGWKDDMPEEGDAWMRDNQ